MEKLKQKSEIAELRKEISQLTNAIDELQEVVSQLSINTGDSHSSMTISESLAILAIKAAKDMKWKGY